MRKRFGLAVALVGAISLLATASAPAAVEVGSNCIGSNPIGNYSILQLGKAAGSPLPLTAPDAGIVTKWTVNSAHNSELSQQLKIFRATSDPKKFVAVGESSFAAIRPMAINTFETRIPVQAGDRFGVYGGPSSSPLYCATSDAADVLGYVNANVTVGGPPAEFIEVGNLQVAVSATVEPDADGDGYGDETQDKCPRSAVLQAVECPLISLGAYGLAQKGSALILASASSQAQVAVTATATLPKKGKGGKKPKRATVTIQGGTKAVGPGQIVPFTLTYPPSFRSALAATPPGKSLTLTVTTSTTDLAGQASSTRLNLKLKGQKKGKAKAKGKG